jgi:hypothetical protein
LTSADPSALISSIELVYADRMPVPEPPCAL